MTALSIDSASVKSVHQFYDQVGIKDLRIYINQSMRSMGDLGIYDIPTTLLLSPDGQELGRLVGPETWDSYEIVAFLKNNNRKPKIHDRCTEFVFPFWGKIA